MQQIHSPITQNKNVSKILEIPALQIIQTYESELNMDVKAYFRDIDSVSLFKCEDTGYRFYSPFTLEGDGRFYPLLKNVFSKSDYYRKWKYEYQIAKEEIHKQAIVLDIGCGDGYFLEGVLDKTSNCIGIELSEEAVLISKAKGLNVENTTLHQLARNTQQKFDVICAFQVLEHLSDVKSFFEDAISLLKNDGKLIIGVPDNSPYIFGYKLLDPLNLPPHHMGLWNKDVFVSLQKIFPLKLEKITYDKKSSLLHYMYLLSSLWLYKIGGFKLYRHVSYRALFAILCSIFTFPIISMRYFNGSLKSHTIICIYRKIS